MYIKKIELENIKCFDKFTYELESSENPAGWHVILGNNGAGKSTLIRAVAAALIGPDEALKSREVFADWVHADKEKALVRIELIQDKNRDQWAEKSTLEQNISYTFTINKDGKLKYKSDENPNKNIWSGKEGWFSVSYGPFRRFSGGNSESQKLLNSSPLLARHLSVFGEDVALTETLEWLKDLRFKQLENESSLESGLLKKIKAFINQDNFLPDDVLFESVSSEGIKFIDGFGNPVSIESLSDGYRSILSLTLELIRQMSKCYKTNELFSNDFQTIDFPGVVFIDEVDVHLHPSWQRSIGEWMTRHFPKIQFIVTTHSPLICQSAVNGSVWLLSDKNEDSNGERLVGTPLDRLVYGNILEAFSSGAFGEDIQRSEQAKIKQERLAELNVKKNFGDALSEEERTELSDLQRIFGLSPEATEKEPGNA